MTRVGMEHGKLQQIFLHARASFQYQPERSPIWSSGALREKIVYLVELTVPHEDNIDAAKDRKDERYEDLVKECEEAGWSAAHFSVEVGCRGFVGERLRKWFTKIGLNTRQNNAAIQDIQATVEKASHWIWLKREDDRWLE